VVSSKVPFGFGTPFPFKRFLFLVDVPKKGTIICHVLTLLWGICSALSCSFTEFKGALTENYVAQELNAKSVGNLYYWTSQGKAELDFIVPFQQKIFPLEVKAGISKHKKSLLAYGQKYHQNNITAPVLSCATLRNFSYENNIANFPLYSVACFPEFLLTALIDHTAK